MSIRDWLETVGLPQFADAFEAEEIDVDLLRELDHDALRELGVDALGHRLTILRAARSMAPEPPAASDAARTHDKIPPTDPWEAERRQLTIMFGDLAGATALSARMDPEDFRDLIRRYHEAVAAAATEAGGHVGQFLGDGALIYFGYPAAQEDAAERAVGMGFALIQAADRIEALPGETLKVRVGIASGMVIVGDIIGRGVDEGAVVSGETPNLAARLQSLAEPNTIVVSDSTHQLLGRAFRTERLAIGELKGFDEAQGAWRVVGRADVDDRFEAYRGARLSPLVGRDAELDALVAGWQAAREGHGRTILIRGEAGLGKSRLLHELSVRAEGCARAQLQCSPYFSTTSLHPVRRAIEQFAGLEREDDTGARLSKVMEFFGFDDRAPGEDAALVANFMGLPAGRFPTATASVGLQRARLFQVVIDRIRRMAGRAPLLLFCEDLHWSDPTTIEFLGLLIGAAPECALLIVATFRPEFETPWETDDNVVMLEMRRLGRREIRAIIDHISGDQVLPGEICDTLDERADGVPLFVEELTKSVIETRAARSGTNAAAVPATLLDTLMARLDRIVTARSVAQMASVIGRDFDEDLLAALAERPPREVRRALETLEGADLVARGSEDGVWAFHHALIRDAAYESLLRRSRQDLHLRIARALEAAFPERAAAAPEIVARHYGEAGEAAGAAPLWLAASRQARQRGAVKEAQAHVLAGLEQVQRMAPSPGRDRLELLLEMTQGYIHFAGAGYASPVAEAAFARAGTLSASVTDAEILTPFHNGYGVYLTMKGDVTAGHEELTRLVGVTADQPHLRIYAETTQTWSHYNRGAFRAALDWGRRLDETFRAGLWDPAGPRHTTGDPYVIGSCFHAAALWAAGFPDRAMAKAGDTLDYALTLNDPFSVIYAQVNGVCRVADLCGYGDRVLAITTEAVDLARRNGYEFALGFSRFWQARAMGTRGEVEEAIAIAEASLAACRAVSVRYHEPHFRAILAVLQARAGDLDGAGASLDGIGDLVESSGELWQRPDVHCARAEVAERAGDSASAEAAWNAALAAARGLDSPSWELRAAIGRAGRRPDQCNGGEVRAALAAARKAVTGGLETADVRRADDLLSGHA